MPAFGGKYKGTRFRSLLELSVIVGLEEQGLVLGTDILYETVRVPYGRTGRVYVVDFHLPTEQVLIEVKPVARTQSKTFKAKCKAATEYARQNSMTFIVVTERDIERVLTLEQASKLDGIEWGVRARRKMRRKR